MTRFWTWLAMVAFNVYRWAGRRARKSCRDHVWNNEHPIRYCERCHWGLLE